MKGEREINLDSYPHSQKQNRVGPMKSGHEFTRSLLYFDFYMITFCLAFVGMKYLLNNK